MNQKKENEKTEYAKIETDKPEPMHNQDIKEESYRKSLLMRVLNLRRDFTYTYQKFLNMPREYYPGERMYMGEVHVVIAIGEHGIDNVGELAQRLDITKGAVSQFLKKLEDKGFVLRIQDGNDKRQFSVKLTEKGKDLCRIHTAFDKERYAKVYPLFSEFTVDELEYILRFDQKFKEFTERIIVEGKSGIGENY